MKSAAWEKNALILQKKRNRLKYNQHVAKCNLRGKNQQIHQTP